MKELVTIKGQAEVNNWKLNKYSITYFPESLQRLDSAIIYTIG